MELQHILDRYAEAVTIIDGMSIEPDTNPRTSEVYLPGFRSMSEAAASKYLLQVWESRHPEELTRHSPEFPYTQLSEQTGQRATLDHAFSGSSAHGDRYEWGIEIKRIQLAGDNGRANDFATAKVLSPYLRDRGMLHDALRLRAYGPSERLAVVGYGFEYDESTVNDARHRFAEEGTRERQVIESIADEVRRNGARTLTPLIEMADSILRMRGLTQGPRAQASVEAWRHPAGGRCVLFGWEIRRLDASSPYDLKHPW